MPRWQIVILIVFSVSSLIIALYCLIFMVPLKRFRERISSLGGGMKGIESYVGGVRERVEARLGALEEQVQQQLDEGRQTAESAVDALARDQRELRREVEKLRKEAQSLQAELRETRDDAMKVVRSHQALSKRLEQIAGDFDALDVELRESVRQLVADSFSSVESMVLSALEAVQEEMLYGPSEPSSSPKGFAPRRDQPRPAPRFAAGSDAERDNIITVEPLFARLRDEEREGRDEGEPQQEGGEAEEGEGEGEA